MISSTQISSPPKKVYCINCYYYRRIGRLCHCCEYPVNITERYSENIVVSPKILDPVYIRSVADINKNNLCAWFEPMTLWQKLWR